MTFVKAIPFLSIHVTCLAAFWVGVDTRALILCFVFYVIRMFGITAGYHRYFSHRAYKTSRWFQFVLAWLGCSAMQKGPLWWAAHHRHHHKFSDTEDDPHSPIARSIWWSHVGWVISTEYDVTHWDSIRDFEKYPELRWLNEHHWVPGLTLAALTWLMGGWTGLIWGFFISTVLLYHGTFCVNSICHLLGARRYQTTDASRNNAMVAIITLGEGWHNNHHHYQSSANQGFFWWEVDFSYYIIKMLGWSSLVWDIRKPPEKAIYPEGRPEQAVVEDVADLQPVLAAK